MMPRQRNRSWAFWLWLAALGAALMILALALQGWWSGHDLSDRAAVLDASLERRGETTPPDRSAGQPTQTDQAVKRIQERFLFSPRPPEMFRRVQGVLGDRVLYPGGQSFGIGDNAMGATVVAIGSNWVELEHNGRSIIIDVFKVPGAERGRALFRREEPATSDGGGEARKAGGSS